MANLRLHAEERARITADYKDANFIDVCGHKDEIGISIDFYPSMQYVEIRKKRQTCKQFFFKKKSDKRYFDFGYWEDAKVIFALNEVTHK